MTTNENAVNNLRNYIKLVFSEKLIESIKTELTKEIHELQKRMSSPRSYSDVEYQLKELIGLKQQYVFFCPDESVKFICDNIRALRLLFNKVSDIEEALGKITICSDAVLSTRRNVWPRVDLKKTPFDVKFNGETYSLPKDVFASLFNDEGVECFELEDADSEEEYNENTELDFLFADDDCADKCDCEPEDSGCEDCCDDCCDKFCCEPEDSCCEDCCAEYDCDDNCEIEDHDYVDCEEELDYLPSGDEDGEEELDYEPDYPEEDKKMSMEEYEKLFVKDCEAKPENKNYCDWDFLFGSDDDWKDKREEKTYAEKISPTDLLEIFNKDDKKLDEKYEFVNHPDHYNLYPVETIDMMVDIFGPEKTADWAMMTAFKYRMRLGQKPTDDIMQDLKKEKWYLQKYNELKREKTYNDHDLLKEKEIFGNIYKTTNKTEPSNCKMQCTKHKQ